ncbi:MAG: ABC transporter permease, partial [Caldilineaceae bacterium]|nr:ABC transporter permease [Caldilineaceae bacterium]
MSKATTDSTQRSAAKLSLGNPTQNPTEAIVERGGFWWTLRELFRRRSAQIGGLIVLLLVLSALFAPIVAPYDPYAIDVRERLQPPSFQYPFGTDDLGRDMFSRVIYGARTTIQTGVVVVFIAATLGSLIGLISGYAGGMVDLVIMRIIDVMLAFPYILLALAIVATLGPSLQNALIAIGIAYVPGWARFVRGNVLTIRKQEYVTAAQATGTRARGIVLRHVLPNVLSSIIVLASLDFPAAVLSTAALSYVGLGAQPPTAEWGALLTGARSYM